MDSRIATQYAKFVVDDEPYCALHPRISELNLEYINRLEPDYYEYLADIHGKSLKGKKRQYAALALRTAYSQGLETLFALIGATIQAPHFVPGWLLKYQNHQLKSVIRKIHNKEIITSAFPLESISWEMVANIIIVGGNDEGESADKWRKIFARLWNHLANDFLNDGMQNEYNSIKHGLRVGLGQWMMAMGFEETPGVPAPPDAMRMINQSDFGTTFYTVEKIGPNPRNLAFTYNRRNWDPQMIQLALYLVSSSIHNVIEYLKKCEGVENSKLIFRYFSDESLVDKPWYSANNSAFSERPFIHEALIPSFSKEDILSFYPTRAKDEKPNDKQRRNDKSRRK